MDLFTAALEAKAKYHGLSAMTDTELLMSIGIKNPSTSIVKHLSKTDKQSQLLREIVKRMSEQEEDKKQKISCSQDVYRHLEYLRHESVEHFVILVLNRNNEVIAKRPISIGGQHATVVDPKIIFRIALSVDKSTGIVLCHNHPSGKIRPSTHDDNITKKLVEAGKALDMPIIDHLIIGGSKGRYYSYADEGRYI